MESNKKLSNHSGRYIWNVDSPKNAAVHFGNFHQHQDDPGNIKSSLTSTNKLQFTTSVVPRSKFTRHMIRKLEKLNGSIYYTSQLLSFLDEVVEPPEFSIDLPSTDDRVLEDDLKASYPLWYKNPEKM
ncbi:uncharacterized protein [Chelonus insularis]|uniref:uncharacterized protein n=1 Tax=Chelonus insularis TaxID=460826 RepID=UPI00158DB054|nr:uncharacterized protein LOC118065819 [Chelonus insularis]